MRFPGQTSFPLHDLLIIQMFYGPEVTGGTPWFWKPAYVKIRVGNHIMYAGIIKRGKLPRPHPAFAPIRSTTPAGRARAWPEMDRVILPKKNYPALFRAGRIMTYPAEFPRLPRPAISVCRLKER